jgi:hypothetical protein
MRKFLLITTLAAGVAVAAAASAQPYGPGMMGGYGPGWGMMGGGYGAGPECPPGCGGGGGGPGWGYGGGYGPGMMRGGGYGPGPGMMWGQQGYYSQQADRNLSADDVKKYLEGMLRNPNLKVGDVKEKDADTITADVVTKEKGDLVQRFDFNRHNGFYRTED